MEWRFSQSAGADLVTILVVKFVAIIVAIPVTILVAKQFAMLVALVAQFVIIFIRKIDDLRFQNARP